MPNPLTNDATMSESGHHTDSTFYTTFETQAEVTSFRPNSDFVDFEENYEGNSFDAFPHGSANNDKCLET